MKRLGCRPLDYPFNKLVVPQISQNQFLALKLENPPVELLAKALLSESI